jgi:uncharacterized protein YfaS (alpha-2-macroglobulin family)
VLANGGKKELKLPKGLMPKADFSSAATALRFGSGNDYVAYTLIDQSGFDRELPKQEIRQGIEVFREYVGADGKPAGSVKLGDELEVRLRIRAIGRDSVRDVAIMDLLPGGFEIVPEPRGDQQPVTRSYDEEGEEYDRDTSQDEWVPPIGSAKSSWHPDYADVREDRVVLYGTAANTVQEFSYRIKATNAGNYTVPPTFAEGMYDRTIRARALAGKIVVEGK